MADPHYHVSKPVDMILGAFVFEELIENQLEEVSPDLFLRNTVQGCVVLRKQGGATENNALSFLIGTLRKFWEIESLPTQTVHTEEEVECEKHSQETTDVVANRFVVKLPSKKNSKLYKSLTQAQRRLDSLDLRLNRSPELRMRHSGSIEEFISLDHMEVIPQDDSAKSTNKVYYLLHHCVFKEDSTTTKLHVVFNDSAKTSNGIS